VIFVSNDRNFLKDSNYLKPDRCFGPIQKENMMNFSFSPNHQREAYMWSKMPGFLAGEKL